MKAVAVFPVRREIALVEHEEPRLERAGQVKIRMLEVGICGTDKEICSFAFGEPPRGEEYFILGHESLGEVVEVGKGVSRVEVGDLVVMTVRHPCAVESCIPCQVGRQDYCESSQYSERGIRAAHGFMTEYIVEDEEYINLVPWSLREVAVLIEPLTVAEKAFARLRQMQQHFPWLAQQVNSETFGRGQKAVVLGAGPVGLLGMMCLVKAGFETIVYSRSKAPNARSALVEAVGARYISSLEVSVEEMAKEVGRIDVVYEALGASGVALDVLHHLGPHGIFVFTGVPGYEPAKEIELDRLIHHIVMFNQALFGTVNASPESFTEAISDLEVFYQRWPEVLVGMITGRYPIERYQEVLSGQIGGIKNVLVLYTGEDED